jgi:actin-related protein 9
MFLAPDGKTYEPYKIRARKKEGVVNGGDVVMGGLEPKEDEDDEELIELPEDDEDAVWPLKGMLFEELLCKVAY